VKKMIRKKFNDLGPVTFHEAAVLVLFLICVMLWFFRDPGFVPGWAHFIEDAHVDDATAVMIIVMFLFSIPAKPSFWCLRPKGGNVTSSCANYIGWDKPLPTPFFADIYHCYAFFIL
jgi:hypothetical protein